MINTCKNTNEQHYKPIQRENYMIRLKQLLKEELNIYGKPKILDLLADEIKELTEECYPKGEYLRCGQIRIIVPAIEDKPTFSQRIEDTKLISVTISLITEGDIDKFCEGEKKRIINQERLARIAYEAKEQGGVLSQSQVAVIFGTSQTHISKLVKEYQLRTGKIIPLRGIVHDIGRSTTHKRWIISLYLKGYTENEILWITGHSLWSIGRYIKRYKQVEELIKVMNENTTCDKISRLLGISKFMAWEYLNIYRSKRERQIS